MIKRIFKRKRSQAINDIIKRQITYRLFLAFLVFSVFLIWNLLATPFHLVLFMSSLFTFAAFVCILHPLYRKIPQAVIAAPMLYLLNMTRVKVVEHNESFNQLPTEIKDIFCNIEGLIKEVELSAKQGTAYHFATRIAHDIRSPLAVLNSVVERYKQLGELDVDTVSSICRRISKIADGLLVQNNPREKHHSVVFPYLVLKEVVNEKQYLAEKFSCQVSLTVSEEVKYIFCQASALELSRVISNLINNAMEAMTGRGHVDVGLACDGQAMILSVQDDGAGMAEVTRAEILSGRSISTKAKGAGIGLRSAIEYIQSLSGELSINTQPGLGTTITIRLPVCDSPAWFLRSLILYPAESIVVVDDESKVYEDWQEKLKKVTANIHYISGAEKSVRAFHYLGESHYDLYLLDYQNPLLSRDGIEIMQEYHLNQKGILVTSNYDDVLLQQICLQDNIKMLPKALIQDLPVIAVNKTADFYLIDDDTLFAKSFSRHVELQAKTIQVFSDVFNIVRCIPLLNKSATFYVDLNIETDRDGLGIAKHLSEQGVESIYLLSGEVKLSRHELPPGVKAVYNKAKLDWSAALRVGEINEIRTF